MKKLLFAALCVGFCMPALAQEKTFTLTVGQQDLQVLSAGLDELPRKISQPVIEKLQKQIIPQMTKPEEAKSGEKK